MGSPRSGAPKHRVQAASAWQRTWRSTRRVLNGLPPIYAWLALAISVSAALSAIWVSVAGWQPDSSLDRKNSIGGPFHLESTTGQPVTEKSFPQAWKLVFFGYTYCPDICPMTLSTVSQALDELGPLAVRVQPLFITVDPERDTLDQLRSYLQHFDPRIIGLSGTQAQIDKVEKAFRVYAAKREASGDDKSYTVDHSALIYLMTPDGKFMTHLSMTLSGPDMATALRTFLVKSSSNGV